MEPEDDLPPHGGALAVRSATGTAEDALQPSRQPSAAMSSRIAQERVAALDSVACDPHSVPMRPHCSPPLHKVMPAEEPSTDEEEGDPMLQDVEGEDEGGPLGLPHMGIDLDTEVGEEEFVMEMEEVEDEDEGEDEGEEGEEGEEDDEEGEEDEEEEVEGGGGTHGGVDKYVRRQRRASGGWAAG